MLISADWHLTKEQMASFDGLFYAPPILSLMRESGALLLLGDLTNNGRPAEHEAAARLLEDLSNRTGARILLLPGNHDLPRSGFGPADFEALYRRFGFDGAAGRDPASLSRAVVLRGATYLLLDTCRPGEPRGSVSRETLNWAEAVLKTAPFPVIACAHHPPMAYDAFPPDLPEGGEELAALLARYRVRYCFAGHRHENRLVERGGFRQVTVGMPGVWPCVLWKADDGVAEPVPLLRPGHPRLAAAKEELRAQAFAMGRAILKRRGVDDPRAEGWFEQAYLAAQGMDRDGLARLARDPARTVWQGLGQDSIAVRWILEVTAR
ncbi:MAG: metallophosphoesterase [Clostridia bacterium]|nr:metallophosphoesterase [Clostridia bacterium]